MVEPDVLIVDEVLSVGDVLFRKKCMNRMNEMLSRGTTLLFVSHNMATVKSMCDKAIWLNKGEVVMSGDMEEVCNEYTATIEAKKAKEKEEKLKKEKALDMQAKALKSKRVKK